MLPERGCEIYEFRDRSTGVDVLFKLALGPAAAGLAAARGQRAARSSCDNYGGGWQELLPSCNDPCTYGGVELPFHGEVAVLPWDVGGRCGDDAVELSAARGPCERTPFALERRMRVERAAGRRRCRRAVENLCHAPVQLVWGHHCVVGAPFLEAGCRLCTPAGTIVTLPETWEDTARLAPGQREPVAERAAARRRAGRSARGPGPGVRLARRRLPDRSRRRRSPSRTRASAARSGCASTTRCSAGCARGSPTAARTRCRSRAPTRSASSRGSARQPRAGGRGGRGDRARGRREPLDDARGRGREDRRMNGAVDVDGAIRARLRSTGRRPNAGTPMPSTRSTRRTRSSTTRSPASASEAGHGSRRNAAGTRPNATSPSAGSSAAAHLGERVRDHLRRRAHVLRQRHGVRRRSRDARDSVLRRPVRGVSGSRFAGRADSGPRSVSRGSPR